MNPIRVVMIALGTLTALTGWALYDAGITMIQNGATNKMLLTSGDHVASLAIFFIPAGIFTVMYVLYEAYLRKPHAQDS